MELPTYFTDFMSKIRPDDLVGDCQTAHTTLRQRLWADPVLPDILVHDFLQGSYVRHTAIKPKEGSKADVDIIVVTNLDENDKNNTPQHVMDRFHPFLNRHYKGQWVPQGRSIGIELETVAVDLVVTSAPSQVVQQVAKAARFARGGLLELPDLVRGSLATFATSTDPSLRVLYKSAALDDSWRDEPLRIPDREAKCWVDTHPLAQIDWTTEKQKRTNGYFIDVVRCVKWWRQEMHPEPERPKGYPLEHLVGECCPDEIKSVAEGITRTLEEIVASYGWYAANKQTPPLNDRGVDYHNVMARVEGVDFAAFYEQTREAALIARDALDNQDRAYSARRWRELLGDKFPMPDRDGDDGGGGGQGGSKVGYSPRTEPSVPGGGRFA